jgi:segregation and condensation protein A
MGVTVTFVAILELVREGLIDIVQTEAYAPLHVRGAQGARGLKLAVDNDAAEEQSIVEVVGEAANESVLEPEVADDVGPQKDGETHE